MLRRDLGRRAILRPHGPVGAAGQEELDNRLVVAMGGNEGRGPVDVLYIFGEISISGPRDGFKKRYAFLIR